MSKVYCADCKHHIVKHHYSTMDTRHYCALLTYDSPISPKHRISGCQIKNGTNDCQDYKKESIWDTMFRSNINDAF